jgi:phosphatidylinositol glycan class B
MRLVSSSSKAPFTDYLVLIREAILCGSAVLLLSAGSDYLYYGQWTFPAYHWLHFNLAQDLAVFYGRNAWHYYLSQGLPLLLTTYTPFALVALFKATTSSGIPFILSTSILTTIASLSLISHKEVRFIFPLLPLLHLLAAPTVSTFFYTAKTTTRITHSGARKVWTDVTSLRPILMYTLLVLNVLIAAYATLRHQTGPLSVTKFLRQEYEELALDPRGVPTNRADAYANDIVSWSRKPLRAGTEPFDHDEVFAGFLMPCHSTPWRSRLYHRDLRAWALGCEPPIGKDGEEREAYRDEADRFYDDPKGFLEREMNTRERPWPRYIVGFEGVGDALKEYYESAMKGFKVRERWRGRSSDWHDDWRRKGDVVVWEFVDGSVEG